MLADGILVLIGMAGLFVGGESLVKGAARLAAAFGIPVLVVGLTVVAFGTSMPELLVSVNAASSGSSDISLGNVLGSNIANIGLILGVAGLLTPVVVEWRLIRQEIPMMVLVSLLLVILALDGEISRADGALLLALFAAFIAFSVWSAVRDRAQVAGEITEFLEGEHIAGEGEKIVRWREALRVVFGVIVLALAADWTVRGAVGLARTVGISEIVIGITLVAVGTSLPELVASVMAARRRESDIITGNVVGSNIANIVLILGTTSVLQPISVDSALLGFEFPAMMFFAVLIVPFVIRQRLTAPLAAVLLALYFAFVTFSLVR